MAMVSRRFSLTQIHWVIVLYELLAFNTWDLGPGAGPAWWNSKNIDDHRCGLQSPFADDRLHALVKVTIGFPHLSTFALGETWINSTKKSHPNFHFTTIFCGRALGSRRCCPRWRSGNAMPSASVPGNWRASSGQAERRKIAGDWDGNGIRMRLYKYQYQYYQSQSIHNANG